MLSDPKGVFYLFVVSSVQELKCLSWSLHNVPGATFSIILDLEPRISAGAKIRVFFRAFIHSFLKLSSRHSFTHFRALSFGKVTKRVLQVWLSMALWPKTCLWDRSALGKKKICCHIKNELVALCEPDFRLKWWRKKQFLHCGPSWMVLTHKNVIFDILEPSAFQKN